jgi:hypothetical protein
MSIVDDDENKIFNDEEGFKTLSELSPKIIRKLATEAVKMSLLNDINVDEAKNNLKN